MERNFKAAQRIADAKLADMAQQVDAANANAAAAKAEAALQIAANQAPT